jgi:hypothetical protein
MDEPSDPMSLDVALTERLQHYAAARAIHIQRPSGQVQNRV